MITSKDTFPYVEKTDSLSQSMYHYLVDEAAAANKPDSAESLVQQIASSGLRVSNSTLKTATVMPINGSCYLQLR